MSPEPTIRRVHAARLLVGQELLTPDGWQHINGLIVFRDADQVSVFTDQRDDEHTDGWRFTLNERVKVRTPRPTWSVESYAACDGTVNHASFPQSVIGDATYSGKPIEVGVWVEQRNKPDGTVERVGILEKKNPEDVELCACRLRQLARHLLAVAEQVDGHPVSSLTEVPVVSDDQGDTAVSVRTSRIAERSVHLHTGRSGEDLMLRPAAARRLADALIAAAG